MTDDKWFIRGISPELTRRVTDIARRDRRTVGAVVTEALTAWLDRQPDVTDEGDGHQSLAAAIAGLLKRVACLEATADTETPLEATGVPAGAVDAASAVAGAEDSTGVLGAAGTARKRLAGDAKAERVADIKRRLVAGESKPEILAALGISLATLNRALAE